MFLKEFQGAFVEGLKRNSLGRIHFGCQKDPFSVSGVLLLPLFEALIGADAFDFVLPLFEPVKRPTPVSLHRAIGLFAPSRIALKPPTPPWVALIIPVNDIH